MCAGLALGLCAPRLRNVQNQKSQSSISFWPVVASGKAVPKRCKYVPSDRPSRGLSGTPGRPSAGRALTPQR